MLVPLSWLRDFAPFDLDPVELGRVLDELGMVVDRIERVGEGLDEVVVAKVVEIAAIPKADKIRRVVVDAGAGPIQVVCGAWNFEEGATVAFAPVGTKLPGVDFVLEQRKMRGVESNGMICSARELSLGEDHAGIMVLSDTLTAGTPLMEALGIDSDVVYDLDIETNRPDANCIAGVARDAAAKLGLPFAIPDAVVSETAPSVAELTSVVVESPDLCPRFTARVIRDVRVGPGPRLVQQRLTLAGMRPINNVVDASNYVMLELGQPTHPYDLDRLPGRGLLVRRARPGEVIRTLDDVERRLGDGDDCLICDAEGTPVGIGGIMGGASSEISESTTTVLLEAANFDAMTIARTSKRLGLRTEASARFERGCDAENIDRAVNRFCGLLGTGTVAAGMLDERAGLKPRPRITVRTSAVNALLGTELADADIRRYLGPLGFELTPVADGVHEVVPPPFRPDVTIEANVTEEVARHHGYESIPKTVPSSPHAGRLTPYQADRRLVRQVLVGLGLDEAMSPSMLGPGDHERASIDGPFVAAANAMIKEESILRASLRPGLLRALAFNAARRQPDAGFFEIGNVWRPASPDRPVTGRDATLPDERESVAIAVAGPVDLAVEAWLLMTSTLRLAEVGMEAATAPGMHPGRTAHLLVDGSVVGVVGEVDPAVVGEWDLEDRVAYLEVELVPLLAGSRRPEAEQPVSRFPSSDIDLAFVVADRVPAGAVATTIRASAGELLVHLHLFDVYRGAGIDAGHRSLAYRLRFCALDHTLTDAEVGEVRAAVIAAVESAHAARLRG